MLGPSMFSPAFWSVTLTQQVTTVTKIKMSLIITTCLQSSYTLLLFCVFLLFCIITGRICRSPQAALPVLFFTHDRILGFFAPQGRHASPIKVKFGREQRTKFGCFISINDKIIKIYFDGAFSAKFSTTPSGETMDGIQKSI